jgi:hypothetical protein
MGTANNRFGKITTPRLVFGRLTMRGIGDAARAAATIAMPSKIPSLVKPLTRWIIRPFTKRNSTTQLISQPRFQKQPP